MKNLYLKFAFVISMILTIIACKEDDINPLTEYGGGESLVAFRNTTKQLGVTEDETTNYIDIVVDASTVVSNDRALTIQVNAEETTATPDMYSIVAATEMVPGDSHNGAVRVLGSYDAVPLGETFKLVLDLVSIEGGGIISESKNRFVVNIVKLCPVADDFMTGDYLMYTGSPCVYGDCFGDPQTVEIVNVGGTQRQFSANYLAQFGIGQPDMDFVFDLVCNELVVQDGQNTFLACTDIGLTIGTPDTPGVYNSSDDTFFELKFKDNIDGDCDAPPVEASVIFEKL